MIERLSVRDFILVDSLEIEFSDGFNVLSGETGAGKSILVGALSLLFGAKGEADLVRSGAQEAMVAGEFRVANHDECLTWLSSRAIEPEEGVVIVRRTLRQAGRGTIYIQSTPVTRADLEEFAGLILDLHSQHEHQSLFSETNHRKLLDRFAGIEDRVQAFRSDFTRLQQLQEDLRRLRERESERAREMEILRHAIDEIETAALTAGEETELESERARMAQYERLAEHAAALSELLEEGEAALVPQAKLARRELAAAARIDESLAEAAERFESVAIELEDLAHTLAGYRASLVYDPARLDEIEERLATLRSLMRKYGDNVDAVSDYAENARRQLDQLENLEENRDSLTREIAALEQTIVREARALHAVRSEAAGTVQERIREVLAQLAMGRAEFVVEVATKTNEAGRLVCGPEGADRVRFLISTNPGESPRPLARIASGGEISRVMLAIKTVLADIDEVRTLVFDEIDTGIGGQVALALASHMRRLADRAQVICITHLATIAVRADNHVVVEKSSDGRTTSIGVRAVTGDSRVREIARMLAGDGEEALGLEHAESLLRRYTRDTDGQD